MQNWIGAEFDKMSVLLKNGEFCPDKLRKVCSTLNGVKIAAATELKEMN